MYEFNYHRPKNADQAAKLFGQCDDAAYMSGGMNLIPTMKQRLASYSDVIDLGALGNSGIEVSGDQVVIKAGTCHGDVAESKEVAGAIPALGSLAGMIGDPQVRNRGTIGGSIANNDPAADYPAALLGLGAVVVTADREIAADDFFLGLFDTALNDGEIVTEVRFPLAKRAGYAKFPNPASRYAIVGAFVAEGADGVRVAITGAGPVVFRVKQMEDALGQNFSADALQNISVSQDGFNSDMHAGADYRAHLVGVMARRAVEAALG